MFHLKAFILITSLIVWSLAPLQAQQSLEWQQAPMPQFAGVYKLETGSLNRSANSRNTATSVLYNNTTVQQYYLHSFAHWEVVDEGSLCDRDSLPQEQISAIDFSYCSGYPDPTQNSGNITLVIYDETIECSGPSGSYVNGGYLCAYDLTDLPLGAANGSVQCWDVQIDLRGGFECPNTIAAQACNQGELLTDESAGKLFGWSFIPRNDNTGPPAAFGGKNTTNNFVLISDTGNYEGCWWNLASHVYHSFVFKLYGDTNPDGRSYRPCTTNPRNSLMLEQIFFGGTSYQFTIHRALSSESVYLCTSFHAGEQLFSTGSLLLDRNSLLPPGPIFVGSGPTANIILNLGAAANHMLYSQAASFSGRINPTRPVYFPTQWSNGYCDYIP